MKLLFSSLLLGCFGLYSIHSLANEPRDPTRPPLVAIRAPVAREPKPILSAIMGSAPSRVAIFNGQLVHAGSYSGEFLIEAVFEDGVRYRHAGRTEELHLPHAIISVKKPSAAVTRMPAGAS